MRILTTQACFGVGGTETYTATVADQLERLGHTVTVHAAVATDGGREMAASLGLRLRIGAEPPGEEVDAVLAQDTASAYLLAGRRPAPRQVFAIHGLAPFERPPVGLSASPTVIVFNDRIARRAAALATRPEVVRLRQPIDIGRFRPRTPARGRARRLLVLSNRLDGWHARVLADVCAELGLELARIGVPARFTVAPEEEIAGADIVVGYGRSVLEGMAMGRAAYVWDRAGGDGWVTPESYAALEADGFSGGATDAVIDAERLRADLAGYRPELGDLGFDLVRCHHSAAKHAEALVDLLVGAGAPRAPDAFETIALLVRAEQRAMMRAEGAEISNGRIWEEVESQRARAEAAEAAAAAAEAAAARGRAESEERLGSLLGSRSWRLTSPLRRLAARWPRR